MSVEHRYLMTRLSLQVVYLWRHVSSTAPPFILWWSNLVILFGPLHRSSPFIGELRCQAIQMEHGPYIAERTQNAVFILWADCNMIFRVILKGESLQRALTRGCNEIQQGATPWLLMEHTCIHPVGKGRIQSNNLVFLSCAHLKDISQSGSLVSTGCRINIAWVDWAYKSSTCDSAAIYTYYGGQI
jgi:hypothetical protein